MNFNSDIRNYTVYVKNDTTSISFTPVFANGTLEINGSFALNNRAYRIPLDDDNENVIFVRSNASGYADSEYTITVVRFEGIKAFVSDDGNSFVVNPINIEKGKSVILAIYDDNGFVEMQSDVYKGEAITFGVSESYIDAKVMLWEDMTTLKPVCKVNIVK